MDKTIKKPKLLRHIVIGTVCIVLIIGILLANVLAGTTLRAAFADDTSVSDEAMQLSREAGLLLNQRLEEEGAVLLRNERNTLPIDTSAGKVKVNLFGFKSVDPVYNANGSAAGGTSDAVTLKAGLEAAGFEINETLYNAITAYAPASTDTDVHEGDINIDHYPINEMPISQYTGDISVENLKAYSDIAIINIGRVAGEGQDIPRSGFGADGTGHYLQLSQEEADLIEMLRSHGFKVIVLINSSYAMELGFIESADIDAALWIGGPGVTGFTAVGEILNGTVTPSGKLADTYAYDLTTASTFYSTMTYKYYDTSGTDLAGFTNYTEDIYLGYRWYETAAAVGYWDDIDNCYGKGYDGVVQYPFGYGLSYTTFSTDVTGESLENGVYTANVKVTNTGNTYSGKEVVEVYAEAPYTEGGLEKAKVVLCGFEKTKLLAPGESDELTLTVALEDIASYDENANGGAGAYVLEAGEYTFYVGGDAHGWAGETVHRYTTNVAAVEYTGANKRSSDLQAAENLFGLGHNGNYYSMDNGIETLSRAGGFKNASVLLNTYETVEGKSYNGIVLSESDDLYTRISNSKKSSKWGDAYSYDIADDKVGAGRTYTFEDMYDKTYNDEAWETFVSGLKFDEIQLLTANGGWSTVAIDSVGKFATVDIDGPFGLSNYIKSSMGIEQKCVSYCTEVVTASTFNKELMRELGEAVGAEANTSGTAGWYAPGANTHRSPFGGRNAEYFSEDPYLAGVACANEVSGVQSKGVYVYIKHFAFNDIEANRTNSQNCWLTEQTAREIYLKPFEIAVKDGKARGLMVSYMYTNGEWNGGNYNLVTELIRGEWGLEGMVITDNYCGGFMNATKAVLAGTDLILSAAARNVDSSVSSTSDGVKAMKAAAKHILYAIASVQNNREYPLAAATNIWGILMTALIIFFAAVLIIDILWYLLRLRKYKNRC